MSRCSLFEALAWIPHAARVEVARHVGGPSQTGQRLHDTPSVHEPSPRRPMAHRLSSPLAARSPTLAIPLRATVRCSHHGSRLFSKEPDAQTPQNQEVTLQ